jgi:pyruvate decarboxylase
MLHVLFVMSDVRPSQLTAQELTTMMRHKLNPIVFVLNNKGYTIERYLHGKTRKYNDVVNWSVQRLCFELSA